MLLAQRHGRTVTELGTNGLGRAYLPLCSASTRGLTASSAVLYIKCQLVAEAWALNGLSYLKSFIVALFAQCEPIQYSRRKTMKGKQSVQVSREDRRRSFGIGGAGNIRTSPAFPRGSTGGLTVLTDGAFADGQLKQAPKRKQSSTTCSHPSD